MSSPKALIPRTPAALLRRRRAHAQAQQRRKEDFGFELAKYRRGALRLLVFAAVIAVIVITVPGLASLRSRLAHAQLAWIIWACVLRYGSAISYVVLFRAIFDPRMPLRLSYRLGMSEIATNALVSAGGAGGLALGGWVLHQRGQPLQRIVERSAAFFVFTSGFNVGALAVFGWLAAVGLLGVHLHLALTLIPAIVGTAVVVGAVLLVPCASRLELIQAGCRHHSPRWWLLELLVVLGNGAAGALALFTSRDPRALLSGAGYLLLDIAVLWASAKAFGIHMPIPALALAYLIGQLGGEIPTPGGLGAVDGGIIGALVLYGLPLEGATAAAVIYHGVSLVIPVLFGGFELIELGRDVRGWQTAPQIATANPQLSD